MHIDLPSARYIPNTADPITLIYIAAKRCYSDLGNEIVDNYQTTPMEVMEQLIKKCINSGHESVLEHAYFTFHITCSRACSHQIVRHRLANFSQQSQRYVNMYNLGYIKNKNLSEHVQDVFIKDVEEMYHNAIKIGAKPEDARSYLPNSTTTQLIMTMNARELRHFFNERCCFNAQEEIRSIAYQMLNTLKNMFPCIFGDCGPKCIKTHTCNEFKSCGKFNWT